MTFELPSGLPEGPWKLDDEWAIVDATGGLVTWVCRSAHRTQIARAIASIPDMVEEIGRLRERIANLESGLRGFESDCIELAAECEDADISPAERRTYRAFAASARAILAKSQEVSP